jgi:hypothetical protein
MSCSEVICSGKVMFEGAFVFGGAVFRVTNGLFKLGIAGFVLYGSR